jgi:hypothetical protein
MISNRKNIVVVAVMLVFLLLQACMNDDLLFQKQKLDIDVDADLRSYVLDQRGVFILNEGNFMYDNASLSYYLIDSMKILNDLFSRVNGLPLGDVAQSMAIYNGLAYIVLNNSGKIYIIDMANFKVVGKITGLVSPRYIHFVGNNKAYVTDLYGKAITIIDPERKIITGYISVDNFETQFYQHPTEQMIQIGDRLFVNCWSYDNKILVIDTNNDCVIDSLEVIAQPKQMVVDRENKIWVLSDGGAEGNPYKYESPGLTRFDPHTLEIEKIFRFPLQDNPVSIERNGRGDTLYVINRHVWQFEISDQRFPQQPFITSPYDAGVIGGYYRLGVDPLTSEIYVADAIDHVQRGNIYRFTSTGIPLDTCKAGIIPGTFCFVQR